LKTRLRGALPQSASIRRSVPAHPQQVAELHRFPVGKDAFGRNIGFAVVQAPRILRA